MDLTGFADKALSIFITVFLSVVLGGIMISATWFYMGYRRYQQFICRIWGRDSFGQLVETRDNAGIFVDRKTKNKRFFLRKAKVGLDPDNVPYVPIGNKRIVYLLRLGLKNFRFISPSISTQNIKFDVGEEDVNWAVNAYAKAKTTFAQNMLLQYLPFIALGFTTVCIMVVFIFLFKKFDVMADVAKSFEEAARIWAGASGGTVVMP